MENRRHRAALFFNQSSIDEFNALLVALIISVFLRQIKRGKRLPQRTNLLLLLFFFYEPTTGVCFYYMVDFKIA